MKKCKNRKLSCTMMMVVAMLAGAAPVPGDAHVQAAEENVFADYNPGFNDAGEDGVPYWWYGSSAAIVVAEDETAPENGKCVKVTQEGEGKWMGCAVNATDVLKDGVTYEYTFYAKLDADSASGKTTMVTPVINRIFTDDYSDTDQNTMVTQEEVTLKTDEWTKVTGSFTIDYNPSGAKEAVMQHFILHGNGTGSFYVDDLVLVEKEKEPIVIEDITPLKEHLASSSTITGKAGVALPADALSDEARMELVVKHYNSVTCENAMKPDALLGNSPSYQTDADGANLLDANGDPLLQLNFSQADTIMDYIRNYNAEHPDDIIQVRGHVLVWHSQTPDWFFREGYSTDGAYVSKEKMLVRMENYIKEVMEHYEGNESPYQGMIYAWDVVNEQIETGDYNAKKNPASLRRTCNGERTGWYQVFLGDNSYITQAFVYANQYAPKSVKLFYNDYGETDPRKRDAICALLQTIKDTPGARIDGMGMQAHYSMDSPSVSLLEEAIRSYSAVVDEIQLTELDMQSSNNYDGTTKTEELTREGYRYKEIFDALYRLDQEAGVNITAVTLWGTHDGASWLQSSAAVGGGADGSRPQLPLLFDDNYQAKPAYWGIVDSSKLEPFINKLAIHYSETENFDYVEPVSYQTDIGEISFRALWNEDGIKIQVDVPDKNEDAEDRVVVYAESPEHVFTVYRGDASETRDGYQTIVTIPGETLETLEVGSVISLDVAVFDGDVQMSWNDQTNSQNTQSKYYGQLICKPFMEVPQGTPTIDGELDEVWESAKPVPLTIVTGSPQASGTVRMLWDGEYLYEYFQVTDPDINKESPNAYEQDSVEVFVDQNNAKTGAYEEDDSQYRVNFDNEASFNGTNCTAENLLSATAQTDAGYNVELAIRWIGEAPKAGSFLGLELQINDGASGGTRIGTISWYDETGTGYQDPSVFGTIRLVESLSEVKDDAEDASNQEQENKNPSNVKTDDNGKVLLCIIAIGIVSFFCGVIFVARRRK